MPQPDHAERIAIVGVGGIFPGAPDLDKFWKNIAGGVDSGRPVPEGRWYLSPEKAYAPWPPQPDRVYSTWGCFIEGFQLDPTGISLERDLLARLDPMFHLGLHAARAAFRDAKQLGDVDLSRVGVILGNIALPTESTSAICRDVLGRTFVEKLVDAAAGSAEYGVRSAECEDAGSMRFSSDEDRCKWARNLKASLGRSVPPSNILTPACGTPITASSSTPHSALRTPHSWHPLNRYAAGLPSSLIAQGLGLGGMAFTLDAACASSLYALKFASEELLAHRADAMLAGGMSRPDCQYTQMGFAQLQALTKSGRCAPLSAEADGLVVGEGAGVFVLKRLSDAVAAGDQIYGVITGIGLSNDRGANLLAPHSEGQLRAMRSAYEQAGWRPSDVDLIECHATGTPVGDAVEIASLHELWQHESAKPHQCVIGGVKSNVGHLLTGAGAAGLMKVLFALKHRTLPPTANYSRPAEKLAASNSPFRVLGQAEPWPQRGDGSPRRATINAFGFGGINAHVLIEEWIDDRRMGTLAHPLLSTPSYSQTEVGVRTGKSAHPTVAAEIPVAIVGLDTHVGNWDSKQTVQENDFQGKPLEWTDLNWWGVEQSGWFQREGYSDDTGSVPTQPAKPTGHGIIEVRLPMGQFRIPPLEMQDMLPQQQLMLKVAAGAIRNAEILSAESQASSVESQHKVTMQDSAPLLNLQPSTLDPSRTGVFIGIELDPNTTNFHLRWSVEQDAPRWAEMLGLDLTSDELAEWTKQLKDAVGPPLTPNRVMGNLGGIVASRLAREFDVGGSSFTISCGGDSGRIAFDLAVGALQRGELDRAIVGAVELPCDVRLMLSAADTSAPDGAIAFVLQRSDDARREGRVVRDAIEYRCRLLTGSVSPRKEPLAAFQSLPATHSLLGPLPFVLKAVASFRARRPLASSGRLAFVFPGSGNAFVGMSRELLAAFPDVLRHQAAENKRLRDQYRPDLIWEGHSTAALLENHKAMIFGQVAIGTAICDLLALFGVRPTASIGYSLGESSALFGLRAWTDRDEMLHRMEQSPLFGSDLVAPFDAARKAWGVPDGEDVPWLSGVIDRSAEEVRAAISRLTQVRRVYLLIVNTPTQCVIGGDRTQIEQLVRDMAATFMPLAAPSTVHCEVLREVEASYRELHLLRTVPPTGIDFYSAAWGDKYPLTRESAAEAIVAQAVDTIDFPRVIEQAYADGVRVFVEIGPGSSCTRMIDEILGDRPHLARAALPNTSRPVETFLELLAALVAERVPVDLSYLYGDGLMVDGRGLTGGGESQTSVREIVTRVGGLPFEIPPPPGGWKFSQSVPSPVATCDSTVECDSTMECQVPSDEDSVQASTELSPESSGLGTPNSAPDARHLSLLSLAIDDQPSTINPFDQLQLMTDHRTQAHETFLRFSARAERLAAAHLAVLGRDGVGAGVERTAGTKTTEVTQGTEAFGGTDVIQQTKEANSIHKTDDNTDISLRSLSPFPSLARRTTPPRSLNRDECLTFAVGKIGDVLGQMFSEIDRHPTRVRLPDEPLMLVDRILSIEGEPLSMTSGRVVTEHDIHPGAWYLDCGRIPTCIAVESGQADLFLSGWLGIDFETKGLASYRLLDAVVTFHDALPQPGKTIHYDIRVLHFFRQGQTYLFRFEFDATVDGRPLLTMREGCAGFFTEAELAGGKGIIHTALDKRPRPGKRPADWSDPVPMAVESYDDSQLLALRRGDLAACFGPAFGGLTLREPVTIPGLMKVASGEWRVASAREASQANVSSSLPLATRHSPLVTSSRSRMWLIDRVLTLDPVGGKFGMGTILGELDIHPDDWFLTCHFCDDQVMPGTLMYECCLHTLRIFLLRMGWAGETGQIVYEPIPEVRSRLKCRGQVLSSTKKVWYEVTLKEVGYGPDAYCLADALMYADGKPIVEITDMSVRLTGLSREKVERLWGGMKNTGDRRRETGVEDSSSILSPPSYDLRPAIFNTDRITAFAIGKPSEAFGDRYRVFDEERRIARLPGPPFQFLDRVVSIENCQPWKLEAGGEIVAQYDIPAEAWYFAANRQPTMPFAVLLETALQPCGWLAGYLGSALTSETDLSFRNLGGKAIQYREITPQSGTLTTRVKITKVSQSGGMIIQNFDYHLSCNGEPVYVGDTYFGFFSKASLVNQVGIRDAQVFVPSPEEAARASRFDCPDAPPFANSEFQMVDNAELLLDGGPHGLGYVRGTMRVDPSAWFFQAHFYQDPVVPGSLGLESFFQLMKFYAAARWRLGPDAQFQTPSLRPDPATSKPVPHEWVYRGQVIPRDELVTVTAVIRSVDDANRQVTAEGFLSVDGRVIYQMKNFSLSVTGGS